MSLKRKRIVLFLMLISASSILVFAWLFSNFNLKVTEEFQKMEMAKIKIVNDEDQVLELEVKRIKAGKSRLMVESIPTAGST